MFMHAAQGGTVFKAAILMTFSGIDGKYHSACLMWITGLHILQLLDGTQQFTHAFASATREAVSNLKGRWG